MTRGCVLPYPLTRDLGSGLAKGGTETRRWANDAEGPLTS